MRQPNFQPWSQYREYSAAEMSRRARRFLEDMRRRRTVREFSPRPVPREVVEDCVRTAATAPSGANMQPWHFVVIEDLQIKRRIRQAAEEVERDFYVRRASDEWLAALAPLGTDENKAYLEIAPFLIVVFAQLYGIDPDNEGGKVKHYYVRESVGIATGMLIVALHRAGLASLVHTPSPMDFLTRILGRPANERPFLMLAVGYPAADVRVPEIPKKTLAEVAEFL